MYLEFFGLQAKPFHTTPDPYFLYLSSSHKQALGSIIYGVKERKGFIAVTGEVGLGKTTILRSFLSQSNQASQQIIYLFNPNLSFASVLKKLLRELGHDPIEGGDAEVVDQLHMVLIDEYYNRKTVVLLIDDAQNMPVVTLENLRMLSNLETAQDKLIQIVLLGQPELDSLLDRYELRQIRQRIALRATIRPLSQKESYQYIRHRLNKAGGEGKTIFANGALKRIIRESKGIPRRLNILCDNALVTALGYQKNPVTDRIAKEVIHDLAGKPSHALWKLIPLVAGALILVLALVALMPLADSTFSQRPSLQTIGHLFGQGVDRSRALLTVSKDTNASTKGDIRLSDASTSVTAAEVESIAVEPVDVSSIQQDSEASPLLHLPSSNSVTDGLEGLPSVAMNSQALSSGKENSVAKDSEVLMPLTEDKGTPLVEMSEELSNLEIAPLDEWGNNIAVLTNSEASTLSRDIQDKNVVDQLAGQSELEIMPEVKPVKYEAPLPDLSSQSQRGATLSASITKTMKKGDTLAELMKEVYGSTNSRTLRFVLSHNRHIVNVRNIHPGEQILFPPLTKGEDKQKPLDDTRVVPSSTGELLPPSKKIFAKSSHRIQQKTVKATRPKPYAMAIVQEGDTLEMLAKLVYGSSDPLYVQRVVDFNPTIQNPKKIFPGQNIAFPRLDEGKELIGYSSQTYSRD